MVSAVCLALLLANLPEHSNAQELTTNNLINNNNWTGVQYGTTPIGGLSGGYVPLYNTQTNTIQFGYNWSTVSQTIAVNQALNAAGLGIQVNGYNWSWTLTNGTLGTNPGPLYGNIITKDSAGNTLHSMVNNYSYQVLNAQTFSGTQTYSNPYTLSQINTLNVEFVGKDGNFWAGYYGPLVQNVDVRLRYSVDPCALNPAYSSDCPGFNNIIESTNLVPNPYGYAVFGDSINNSFAINQALSLAGVGISIHGFKWGYVANANGPYCAFWLLYCWDERNPSVTTNVNITSNTGNSLYSVTRTYQNSYNTTNYQYLFPSSTTLNTLGSFNFTATTNDQAYIGSMWTKAIYTPDPCTKDPTFSPTCPGYYEALSKLTTTTNDTIAPSASTSTGTVTEFAITTPTITSSPSPTTNATVTTVSATSSSISATPSASNPQPKVGEVQTAGSPPKLSTSQILNMIATEQSRISTVESSVVQDAVKQAESAGASATSQAETIASVTATQSFSGSGLTQNRVMTRQNEVMLSPINIASASYSLISRQNNTSQDTEIKTESTNFGERNLLNPLMQSRELSTETTQSTQQSSVNRNVRNNEAAGNVRVEDLTAQGANISLYASLIIQDAAFYAPKEIYKNQKVIDNPSSRRMFGGSDSLHQRMVDQQYK